MYDNKKVTAVVLAAGKGTRMKTDINKQYVPVAGIPVLARTLLVFENNIYTDEIVLVVNGEDIDYCQKDIVEKYSITKAKNIVPGGKERQNSCKAGIDRVSTGTGYVLIQDGARPLVTGSIIVNSLAALEEYDACCVCVPVKDTIKIADDRLNIKETPERSTLYAAQTPQGFRYETAKEIYERAAKDSFTATDDSQIAEHYGYISHIVEGSYENIKITTEDDLLLAENIINMRKNR